MITLYIACRKMGIHSLPKYCWTLTHKAHHAFLLFSPFHRQEQRHRITKSLPLAYSASLEKKAKNKRRNHETLLLCIHTWKTGRMLAELLFQIFRYDIHTPLCHLKCNGPCLQHYLHSRTESLVVEESSNTLRWHHHKEKENIIRVILEPRASRRKPLSRVWFNSF